MKKSKILIYILSILILLGVYYIFLPPINPTSIQFWYYIIFAILLFVFTNLDRMKFNVTRQGLSVNYIPKYLTVILFIIPAIFVVIFAINIAVSPLFNAKSWSQRIVVTDGSFTDDIKEVDFNKIPLLDKDSSQKLGDRTMGQMAEYVSQYYVSDLYTQINYNDDIIRVTPIEYDGLIKWITNHNNGINAYITVNSVDGASNLVKIDKGMKYMPSAYFNEDLYRHLRFTYLFDVFGESRFEIDNDGKAYWITPVLSYTGISNKTKVKAVVITDPITGESTKYKLEDVPTWVDNVYYADLIIEQVNNWGEYQNGFWNSIFGQKNVVNTTEGYNYLALNDDIYLYTGITSVVSDESNLGFILTNLRTGETTYYEVPGAEEFSAMESAKGQVQQMSYSSTFPLLINLNNRPTYLVSLKDNAGLVKMYAFIDVQDYQKVVVTDASLGINKAAQSYLSQYGEEIKNDIIYDYDITIKSITSAVKDGNTYYYITDTNNKKFKASIKISEDLPYLTAGNKVHIKYYEEADIRDLSDITIG